MKAGWQTKTLDQISTNLDSRRVPITKGIRVSGEYPYYGASGIVDYVADYIFDEDTLLISEDGANLLARSLPIAFRGSGKYWVNNHAHILKFENMTTQRFVELYLESIPLDDYITGAAQPKLNQKALNSIPIPVPPLPEQQRIVGILDEAFDGIAAAKANAEKNLQNARALFESHLQSVFTERGEGWVEKRLGEIAEVQSGGTPLVSNKLFWGGKIAWYSSGELNDLFTTKPGRHITTAGLNGSNAKLFPKGSLLIGMYDTAALKMSILDRDAAFNQAIAGVRLNDHVDLIFVLHAINAVKPFVLNQRRGVRQKNLSLTKIKEITLNLPVLSEQQAIVSRLNDYASETQRLESIYQRKLAALDDLKKSLLHQAFSGAL